jgi:hypothetical protein
MLSAFAAPRCGSDAPCGGNPTQSFPMLANKIIAPAEGKVPCKSDGA